MKHLALLFIALFSLGGSSYAADEDATIRRGRSYDGSKYIFVEDGIEFSVFPDGEFDFYIPDYVDGVSINVNAGPVGVSFNTGFDYDPYVQYDEYGAVIQIEDTPLYYDYYGRLTQAGDVNINYNNNRISRVGGLRVYYNSYGVYSHYSGFINVYNRGYVFHPYHNFYYRPIFNRCLVFTTPYRRFYTPVRYNYAFHRNNYYRGYNDGYANARRDFRRPDNGRVAHNNGRRDNVDRNNARFNRATPSRKYDNKVASRGNAVTRGNTSRSIAQNNNNRGDSRGTITSRTARGESQRGIAKTNSRKSSEVRTSRGYTTQRGVASRSDSRDGQQRGTATQRTTRKVKPRAQQKSSSPATSRSNSPRKATPQRSSSSRGEASSKSNSRTQSRPAQRPTQSKKASAPRSNNRTSPQSSSRSDSSKKATAQRSSNKKRSSSRTARRG